jgi:hypothetical protein
MHHDPGDRNVMKAPRAHRATHFDRSAATINDETKH